MERKTNQLTFLDNVTRDLGGKRTAAFFATLFDTTVKVLKQRGLILEEGNCVDVTIIETSRGHKSDDGSHTRDKTASYTKKHGRIHHGFKAHIATDTNGIIKDYRFDTAKVHDSQHFDDLTEEEQHSVFADSAYMNSERKKRLEDNGGLAVTG